MKDKIKKAATAVSDHISYYRVTYAFVAGVSVTTWTFYKMDRVRDWNEFLAFKGLTDEYYNPEAWLENLNPTF